MDSNVWLCPIYKVVINTDRPIYRMVGVCETSCTQRAFMSETKDLQLKVKTFVLVVPEREF